MPTTVKSLDIARAAKVSHRTVQLYLARNKKRRIGEHWRFDLDEFPALVSEIQNARQRNRQNAFTRSSLPTCAR